MIVTGNCGDEYSEEMGGPCYEAMEAHLMVEQVDTVDSLYVGSVETVTEEAFSERMNTAYQMGIRLVTEVEKARK